jgi:uncharacterized protein YbaP (TraB family)
MATAYRNLFAGVNRLDGRCAARQSLLVVLVCLFTVGAAAGQDFDHGLLWRIERAGVASSYLFGTMHSDHPAVVVLPEPVQHALRSADAVTLEVNLDTEALLTLSRALLIQDGSTLKGLLGEALFDRAVAAMAGHGINAAMVLRMKPWAVAVNLLTPPRRDGLVLDQVLYRRALAEQKPVDGLESVDEQVALFDSMSLDDQIALLQETLDYLPEIEQMLVDLRQAWLRRDLARLVAISEATPSGATTRFAADFNQRVIVERNHRMFERMQPRLRKGGYFIAVGALHLPGKDGLLKLLSGRGYRLTREY